MLSAIELRYMLALQRVPNLGDTTAKKLLHHVGCAEGIFKEKKQALLKIQGVGAHRIQHLFDKSIWDDVDAELQYIEKHQILHSCVSEPSYPRGLKQCLDGPLLFFFRGNINWENKRMLSIVGTRRATRHGMEFCEQLIASLAPLNPVIVSGFAYGIDITAHKAALQHGLPTIVCLAHGFKEVYPKSHKKYCASIEENGGFITEFWSDDAFDRTNFLQRNRIIAGLTEATIVIESAEKGGSLVTADIANSYNREVFAVPGRTTDGQSIGCNNLIKSQQAHLLTSAADVLYHLGWEAKASPPRQTMLFEDLSTEEELVKAQLETADKLELDQLALQCKMPTHQMATLLFSLEMKGLVRPLPGKLYQAI